MNIKLLKRKTLKLNGKNQVIPPTRKSAPVIQKLAYIHNIKMPNSPTIKIPGV